MRHIRDGRILLFILLMLGFVGTVWGQVGLDFEESLYTEHGVLKILPAYTDSLEAWNNREPRNVNTGYYIIIQKSKHKLHLYKDGQLMKTYSVASGKNAKDKTRENDMATPEGHYYVTGIYSSSTWRFTSPFTGKQSGPGVYGPWFISLNTGRGSFSKGSWIGIGIHGTSAPSSVGRNVSHGCVRLTNKDITEIKNEMAWIDDYKQIKVDILN
ncbi:MAG: L,D-transpeptidase [Candidatus Cloacimonadaceae bacterium]|nr:L,D-transpeptidase [Candidatus Cloacimonadota bacterium]MDX9948854.1 L,D-transpeptidase [Candidatus Syntrophosphaera sp.]NLN84887.1 L,D-transpeptidase [Candidatus Cloacimonadota bacterium]